MKFGSSNFLSMVATLTIVSTVAAFSLGFVYQWTKGPIEAARLEKQMKAIRAVIGEHDNDPVADAFVVVRTTNAKHQHQYRRRAGRRDADQSTGKNESDMIFYPARQDGQTDATAISSFSNNGYSGRIELMVGIDNAGTIRNIKVVSHRETPGLGSKIKNEDFIDQFIGLSVQGEIPKVTKDGGQVDAISGATISSRAFCEAVQSAMEAYMQTKDGDGIKR